MLVHGWFIPVNVGKSLAGSTPLIQKMGSGLSWLLMEKKQTNPTPRMMVGGATNNRISLIEFVSANHIIPQDLYKVRQQDYNLEKPTHALINSAYVISLHGISV